MVHEEPQTVTNTIFQFMPRPREIRQELDYPFSFFSFFKIHIPLFSLTTFILDIYQAGDGRGKKTMQIYSLLLKTNQKSVFLWHPILVMMEELFKDIGTQIIGKLLVLLFPVN